MTAAATTSQVPLTTPTWRQSGSLYSSGGQILTGDTLSSLQSLRPVTSWVHPAPALWPLGHGPLAPTVFAPRPLESSRRPTAQPSTTAPPAVAMFARTAYSEGAGTHRPGTNYVKGCLTTSAAAVVMASLTEAGRLNSVLRTTVASTTASSRLEQPAHVDTNPCYRSSQAFDGLQHRGDMFFIHVRRSNHSWTTRLG